VTPAGEARPEGRRRRLAARGAMTLALAFVACGGPGAEEGAPPPRVGRYDASGRLVEGRARATAPPNVVLICIDTLRHDATAPRGAEAPLMPALAAYQAASTRFVDAASPATWTAPSVGSLLTGLSPWEHGVHGHFHAPRLVPAVATLAEILRSAGYATAAFTGGGWVSDAQGFGQGFDTFRESWTFEDADGALRRYLAARDLGKPLFLFLHTYEAHEPYGRKLPKAEGSDDPARVAAAQAFVKRLAALAPEDDAALPKEEGKRVLLALRTDPLMKDMLFQRFGRERMQRLMFAYDRSEFRTSPERAEVETALRTSYERGLGLLDATFARLVAGLESSLPHATATLLVSDHGEAFGEHDDLGHGRSLHDVLQRVHLCLRAPGRVEGARAVRGSCGLTDVLPTVLDLAGLPASADVGGRSLVALARGERAGVPVEAEEWRREPEEGRLVEERVACARTERAKVIVTWSSEEAKPTERLYDLEADPAEDRPLEVAGLERYGDEFVRAVDRVRARVAQWRARPSRPGDGR
jgi:arylsulfatase A-like enzyme